MLLVYHKVTLLDGTPANIQREGSHRENLQLEKEGVGFPLLRIDHRYKFAVGTVSR